MTLDMDYVINKTNGEKNLQKPGALRHLQNLPCIELLTVFKAVNLSYSAVLLFIYYWLYCTVNLPFGLCYCKTTLTNLFPCKSTQVYFMSTRLY